MYRKRILPAWFAAVLCLFVGTVVFTGCLEDENPKSETVDSGSNGEARAASDSGDWRPIGAWSHTVTGYYQEVFDIIDDYMGYYVNDELIFDGNMYKFKQDTASSDSGIIYLEYSTAEYGVTGNIYAVRWEQLSFPDKIVQLSACSEASGKKTKEEAEEEYSELNKDEYFSIKSPCSLEGAYTSLPATEPLTGKPPILEHFERQALE
jgi:hypothetical protein